MSPLEGDMDVLKSCVAHRTRSKCQKAEEELLNIARMLKAERDEKKKAAKMSSKDPTITEKSSSKDLSDDEGSSKDIEILGEEYVPRDQRREVHTMPQLHRSMSIELIDTPVSSPAYYLRDANQKQGRHKEIGAPTRYNSVSTSEDNKDYKGEKSVHLGGKSDHLSYYISNDDLEGRDDKDDGKTCSVKTQLVEERVEHKEDEGRVAKEIGINDGEDGASRSGGDSDALIIYISDDDLEGREDKGDGKTCLMKRRLVEERVEHKEDESRVGKRIVINDQDDGYSRSTLKEIDPMTKKRKAGCVHKESSKNRKARGLDLRVEATKCHDKARKSQLKQLWPHQVSESGKKKLDSDKPSAENLLPLKFRFEDKHPVPLEKDEEQEEVDNLFAELEIHWTEDEIGSTKLSKVG